MSCVSGVQDNELARDSQGSSLCNPPHAGDTHCHHVKVRDVREREQKDKLMSVGERGGCEGGGWIHVISA